MNLTLFNHKTCHPPLEMFKGWPLKLVTFAVCFNYIFCIRLPCDQTYEAKNGHQCYPCSPGYFKVSDCVVNGEQARCRRCGHEEYQPYCDTSIKCARCRLFCPNGQVPVKHCNATSNKECKCKAGSFWKPDAAKPDEGHCKPHSKCGPGEGRAETGTPYEDTRCEPCREGVSFSDNSSFDICKPCSVCNATVSAKCTVTHDTVCGHQLQRLPSHTKNSSKHLGDSVIAAIACPVILIPVAALVVAFIIYRYRKNKATNESCESDKVDLSKIDSNGENDLENGNIVTQTSVIVSETETSEYKSVSSQVISADENDSSDDSEEDLVKSCSNSQQSQEHEYENNAFDSQSCTEFTTQNEPENDKNCNAIQNAQETKSHQSQLSTGYCYEINDNDLNPDRMVSDVQTDTTKSGDENLQEEDLNEQMQFQGKHEHTEFESNNTDSNSSRSSNENTLPTFPVRNIDTLLDGKITSGNETVKYDEVNINNRYDENTDVSTDAAAVSPRSSLQCGMSHREVTTEEKTAEETESEVGGQFGCNFEDDLSEETIRSDDCSRKNRIWFEIIAFIAQNLKWSDFHIFIMQLVAITNVDLLNNIDVVLEHAKEENNACKNMIHSVMNTWRQATPKATVQAVFDALDECSLKLKCEQLGDALIQKGLLDRRNSPLSNAVVQNEETAEKHISPPGGSSLHIHTEISHEMNELKVPEREIFC
ncbi:uncharacterized protein LOC123554275 [Mercenaria mercenaria]|uniref:uncharacterized protein LOC123554275 n=1 Tax=Mercenaria mercenaria TaxID=6596 RepID=UPI00234FA26A|nr:uncharacterized protein LOC123554275 [Mercenaria mercenaria]XP_053404271.1 uncharacterized protein LOC123554275 [Mercenaria mercenaria]XP_053404272.1 uncharacterized protein LOC123554275 [Mercenaria mercenaria]